MSDALREWVVIDTGDNELTGVYRDGQHAATVRATGEDHYRSMLATGVPTSAIAFFVMDDGVYSEVLDGSGFPVALTDLPLDRCADLTTTFDSAY